MHVASSSLNKKYRAICPYFRQTAGVKALLLSTLIGMYIAAKAPCDHWIPECVGVGSGWDLGVCEAPAGAGDLAK